MPTKPPKELLEEDKDKVQPELLQTKSIKHVIRGLSPGGVFDEEKNIFPVDVVEDYLRAQYLEQGYKLFFVDHLETKILEGNPVAEMMLYVFLRE